MCQFAQCHGAVSIFEVFWNKKIVSIKNIRQVIYFYSSNLCVAVEFCRAQCCRIVKNGHDVAVTFVACHDVAHIAYVAPTLILMNRL
jgi:hypothetical protein